jgi:hypothetical protein
MNKYLGTDAETGGIELDKSLLSAYFVVLDENFQKVDDLYLLIKPNAGKPYVVTAEALEINKINLIEHDRVAITESEAGGKLREFLVRNATNGRLIPLGHNVTFDLEFYFEHLLNKREFQKYASYRVADTGVVGQYLKDAKKIPDTIPGSLGSYVEYFGLQFAEAAHEPLSDTWAAVDVYREMLKL